MKQISKKEQIHSFQLNSTLKLVLECVVCGEIFEEKEDNYDGETLQELYKEHAEAAYKAGWRESVSKVFNHIGIHCPECHEHRNNTKYFER